MRFSLFGGIINKDVPKQEPRRLSYTSIPSLSFKRLPRNGLGGDTQIRSARSTQRSKFHPHLASYASHVDDAQESLRALQESADALPNPILKTRVKSTVSGVSALWQTAKSKEEARDQSQRSLKVLETLAEAVGHDPSNIPPIMLRDIRNFEKLLLEICTAVGPSMEQRRKSLLFRSIRHGDGLIDFDKRLSELQQKFEEACPQCPSIGTPFVSVGALTVPPDPFPHTLESKSSRHRFHFFGLKSRLNPVSSTCADVASTTMKVLEKPGSSVPILNGVVSGMLALWDTAKRVKQSKERAQALLKHLATLSEDVDHDQSDIPPLMLERVLSYRDQLSEVRAAMVPITEQGWVSRLIRLNRNEDILDTFNRHLNEAHQRFMVSFVTQTGVEVSRFQKRTADSLVCPLI